MFKLQKLDAKILTILAYNNKLLAADITRKLGCDSQARVDALLSAGLVSQEIVGYEEPKSNAVIGLFPIVSGRYMITEAGKVAEQNYTISVRRKVIAFTITTIIAAAAVVYQIFST